MPAEFWLWAAWKDKGSVGWLPAKVRDYYLARGWSKAPATWWARYWIHKGVVLIPKRERGPAQYLLLAASDPLSALNAPAKYAVVLSADKAFRYPDLREIIAALRFKGHRVPGWCDCIPAPDGTPAENGTGFVAEYGLDYFVGQAESAAQFDAAVAAGAKVVVGNITALRFDQTELIRKGGVLFVQEDYWNEGWARAQSDLIDAYCIGIYPTAIWNPTIKNYQDAGRFVPGDGLFHVAAVTDWQTLS